MKIKYPNGKKTLTNQYKVPTGNRGMAFEEAINQTNLFYKNLNRALIYKRPTPINVVKTDYTKPGLITQAYFEEPSTTDYNGIYKGRYIDFEAKSTRSKTSFPLSNIRHGQLLHLESVLFHGGIGFFLINFSLLNETYLVDALDILEFIKKNERASIPYSIIKEKGFLVRESYLPRYDYLEILDEHFL